MLPVQVLESLMHLHAWEHGSLNSGSVLFRAADFGVVDALTCVGNYSLEAYRLGLAILQPLTHLLVSEHWIWGSAISGYRFCSL